MRRDRPFRNDFADEVYRKRFLEQMKEEETVNEETPEEPEEDDYEEEDEDEQYHRRKRRMSATERFGLTLLSGLMALALILALDVSGVPVVRIAKKTVYKILRPRNVMHDPFKNPEESAAMDDIVVITRTD